MNHQEAAFVEMINENEGLIFKVTNVYGDDAEDRKDLYQEIVLQLWKSFEKFRNEAKISTWIYRIALNTAITRLRQSKKRKTTFSMDSGLEFLEDQSSIILEERSKILHDQISMLNDIEKAVILLYLDNKNHNEIASITGLSVSNVGTRIARIRQKLKEKISNN